MSSTSWNLAAKQLKPKTHSSAIVAYCLMLGLSMHAICVVCMEYACPAVDDVKLCHQGTVIPHINTIPDTRQSPATLQAAALRLTNDAHTL